MNCLTLTIVVGYRKWYV